MSSSQSRLATVLLFVFAISGFSGLIYQSIWSHYLGLVLGHAAYAQTLVLGLFMGGMALGAWLASRASLRVANLVWAYALAELVIGVLGLGFHPGFVAYTEFSQQQVLPSLSPTMVPLYQWTSASLLILPQCVLLGMTFPLMSAGLLRLDPGSDGRVLGGLYFSNSIGAALGALAATFLLLPAIGMPGAMLVAALANIAIAGWAAWLSRGLARPEGERPAPAAGNASEDGEGRRLARLLLVAAAITGATSFVYEIVWVRLLNQALGTTLHSFELMLCAFILGLAMGGLWIHKQSDRIRSVIRYAGYAQALMGVAALASAPVFTRSFTWVGWLATHLERTDAGYAWFNLGSAGIALAVMFPAAFFAGMTLPLFTVALLRRGQGERAIGRVYAANTVGAIIGVLATVHVLVPALGLHLSLVLSGLVDLLLGIYLLSFRVDDEAPRPIARPLIAGLVAVALAVTLGRPDPVAQASGVFRTGRLLDPASNRVVYLKDGKTATVSALHAPASGGLSILTNGKPDAGMALDLAAPPHPDEITMLMLGALPLLYQQTPRQIALIGWGSGLSTHTALGSPDVERVESIEIEPAMYQGARLFGSRVERAYNDPRSVVVFEDARTHFAAGGRAYDAIVSEPSNPWVSGVASLFTDEFYRFLRSHLTERGVLVQWLHLYEISDELLAKMIAALLNEFPEVEFYLTNSSDLVLVASKDAPLVASWQRLQAPELAAELARVGLAHSDDLRLRRIGGTAVLRNYVRLMGADGHSDFYPEVALAAPRSRFVGDSAGLLPALVDFGMPVLDLIDGRVPPGRAAAVTKEPWSRFGLARSQALAVVDAFAAGQVDAGLRASQDGLARSLERLLVLSRTPVAPEDVSEWSLLVAHAAQASIGSLPAEDLAGAWIQPTWLAEGQPTGVNRVLAAYSAAARRDPGSMRRLAEEALSDRLLPLADLMREQLLLIAMLGAAGENDLAAIREIDQRLGATIPSTQAGFMIRAYLLAWSDR